MKTLYYRYHHTSYLTGFRVDVVQDYGETTVMVSRSVPFPSRFEYDVASTVPTGPNYRLVCPAFLTYYPGTFYIAVQATTTSSFSIEIILEGGQ